ncbi:hypothetical protein IWW37_004023 [Coemansia sp. RSA 2050]|nr:hypothetical protein IWW37_004023 [Coemansia sp. RSA 2050]
MPGNARTAIEIAIAATSCLYMANTNASRSHARIDNYVSVGMTLATGLASHQLNTGVPGSLLSFVSIVTLAVATVVCSTSSNALAMAHIAQCVNAALFALEPNYQVDAIFSILIHAAVAFEMLTPLTKQAIARHIGGVLHVETFNNIKEFENGTSEQASAVHASEFKE